MARQTLIHLHTTNAENVPSLTGATAIQLGEIAVNAAKGSEKLTIVNNENELVTFLSNEQVLSQISSAVTEGATFSGGSTNSITTQVAGKTITADLKVSSTAKNALSVDGTGAYVADKTDDIAANTSAIAAEVSRAQGVENQLRTDVNAKVSAVTAADASVVVGGTSTARTVRAQISATEGNALSLEEDGLMVTMPKEVAYTGVNAIKVAGQEVSLVIDPNDKVLSQGADGLLVNLELNFNQSNGQITLQGNGETLSTIDLPVESILSDAEVTSTSASTAYTGQGPWLVLTFNTSNGPQVEVVDLNKLIDVYTAGNGINVSDNVITAVVDPASESYLTVGATGIRLSGVDAAINDVNTALTQSISAIDSAYKAADAAIDGKVSALSGQVETNTEGIAANASAIEAEETRASGVEAQLRKDINTVSGQAQTNASNIAANTTAITAMDTAYKAADSQLGNRIKALEDTTSGYTAISNQVTANTAAIKVLNSEEGTEGSVAHTAKGYADAAQAAAISAAATDATSKANAAQQAATAVANAKVADVVAGDGISVSTTTGTTRNATVSVRIGANANISGGVLSADNGLELDLSNLTIDCGTY